MKLKVKIDEHKKKKKRQQHSERYYPNHRLDCKGERETVELLQFLWQTQFQHLKYHALKQTASPHEHHSGIPLQRAGNIKTTSLLKFVFITVKKS